MSDLGYLVLRVFFGLTMALAHGWPKLANYSNLVTKFPDPIGWGVPMSLSMAIFGELVCGVLLALGLFTRMASIPLIITMAVAVFVVHSGDPFKKQELGLLYMVAYIAILLIGSGKYSVQESLKIGSSSKIPMMNWLLK